MPRQRRRPFINFTGWLPQSGLGSHRAALAAPVPLAYISVSRVLSKLHMEHSGKPVWHGTTILCVRKGGRVVVAGDGQVSMGQTVVKSNARKLRRLADGSVIAGFAGATADAIALFERLEGKLEQYSGQLSRACVELTKDWRTDRYLRRLEAMMAVADKNVSLILSGTGDVLEPEDGIIGIGSGGGYALAAARALIGIDDLDAEEVVRRAMAIAAGICVYTNDKITLEKLEY
jgi:ATP-dependent HslUV protease, peptidase subunit HslV